ncbi:MAG: nitronate monooxygenase [Deltaproteobacteria bacterium]|jgi:nitronate monooxygenase|nr:nitronate monooxygenase [Deltaproteobacteria bacterium]MBT6435799.1 nitronate monooxygenase [Deltaproteobacteria bacterium]MBT6490993.1 nitronate monooxygenase [Deltaproteobacteria bacterium]
MPLETALSKKLGLKYPIVCAPMFIISNKEMIVAAAEAGILGTMPTLNGRTPEDLRADVEWIRQRTDKPFGLNLTIGLTEPERRESDMQLIEEFEVPVLITSYGNPTEYVKRAAKAGSIVFHDVVNLQHAKKAAAAGVDAIIGVSSGAGGHAGGISPYALIPYLRDNLDVPVIAAGCISTGQQVAASLALGAELAYMGTRFIASKECQAEDAYKQMVVDAVPEDIVYTDEVSGTPANFFKKTVPSHKDFEPGIAGDTGKRWKSIWSAGQGSALIHEVKPVAEIVEDLVREYHDTVARLS